MTAEDRSAPGPDSRWKTRAPNNMSAGVAVSRTRRLMPGDPRAESIMPSRWSTNEAHDVIEGVTIAKAR